VRVAKLLVEVHNLHGSPGESQIVSGRLDVETVGLGVVWCFSDTDTPRPVLSIHADGGPSRSIHVYWLHILNGGDRIGILVVRRDKDGVWLEDRCVCDTRPFLPLLPLLTVTPGSVGASPSKIVWTPLLTDGVAVANGVVFENGVTKSKNRFELCLGCGGVLQLRLCRGYNSWHAKTEGKLVVGCQRQVATSDGHGTALFDV
jgi:hypothetical protein